MKPITFKEVNKIYAKDQPEYFPLPVFESDAQGGEVTFCSYLTFKERLKVLFTGKIWVSLLTFGKPLTPSFLTINKKDVIE